LEKCVAVTIDLQCML